jgi:hypothetical protein
VGARDPGRRNKKPDAAPGSSFHYSSLQNWISLKKLLLFLLFTMPSLFAQTKTLFLYGRTIPARFVIS